MKRKLYGGFEFAKEADFSVYHIRKIGEEVPLCRHLLGMVVSIGSVVDDKRIHKDCLLELMKVQWDQILID